MIISNVFRAQEGVSRSQSGSSSTKAAQIGPKIVKNHQKSSLSALTGDPMAVKLATNQSIFITEMVLSKSFRDQDVIFRS